MKSNDEIIVDVKVNLTLKLRIAGLGNAMKNEIVKNPIITRAYQAEDIKEAVNPLLPYCYYCGQNDNILVRMHAPGEYWQHWDFETQRGCDNNYENRNPAGDKIDRKDK